MGKQLVNNIRGMNPLARRGTLLLLALLTSFACLLDPRDADAAVAALSNWRNTAGTLNTGTLTGTRYYRGSTSVPGATNNLGTIAAGSNRLLVVALAINKSAPITTIVPTVTYGTKTLAVATSDATANSRQHTWLFYLKEADIATAGGTNLSFTYTGNTGTTTGSYANAAVYSGVDQNAPLPFQYQNTYNSTTADTTIGPLATSQVVTAGDYAVSIVNTLNTANATSPTVTLQTGWTSRGSTSLIGTGYARRTQMAYRASAGTFTEQHTASVAVVDSMSAMTLKQQPIPGISNGSTVPNLDVYASDKDKVVDAFTVTGGGNLTSVTITGNATTTATNVSQVHIYRKGDANTTVYNSLTDTLVGTAVTNPTFPLVYSMANEAVVAGTNYIITYDVSPTAIGNGTSITLTGRVTAIAPTGGTVSDTAGATLTVLVTTSLDDATEPLPSRVKNSSAPTLIDAFALHHTGVSPTDDDNVTAVTVTMTPPFISGGTAATLSKIKLVEIIKCTTLELDGYTCLPGNSTVYGSATAATVGDTWNIQFDPATPIKVVATPATYYIRVSTANNIIPSVNDSSGTASGYYSVKGRVTGFQHSKSNNKPVYEDLNSQTMAIDFEAPANVPTFATVVLTVLDTDGTLKLTWGAAADLNGGALHPTKPYKIMRGAPNGGYPNPSCIDGTDISTAGAVIDYVGRTATDVGLVSTQATQYKYRICTVDSLNNISKGMTVSGTAKVHSVCGNMPIVKLVPDSQIVKTPGTPFGLQIANMDTGVCPDVTFAIAMVNQGGANPAHFTKSFPTTVTLGTGGLGHASTGTSVPIIIGANTPPQGQSYQLENFIFGMTLTAAGYNGGLPINAVTGTGFTVNGLLNDMPPIVHNSANMGKFSYGGWGQTYTCATCHSNSTTNIKGVYTLVSTPIGRRNVVFTKTSSGINDLNGVYSNDKRTAGSSPNNRVSNQVCSVCHHRTRQHQYSSVKSTMGNIVGPGGNEAYDTNHNNARDCVQCHTHNSAFRSITGVCGDCHGTIGTGYAPVDQATRVKDVTNSLGPLPPNYGAHAMHTNKQVACAACHSNSNHGNLTAGWLGDSAMQIGFQIDKNTFTGFNPNQPVTGGSFWGTSNLNYPFNWVGGADTTVNTTNDYNNSCVTYCHGNWTGNTDQGSQQQPIWVGDGNEIVCGSCHYATGTTPPQSSSHLKHSATTGAGLGIGCTKCHGTYTSYSSAAAVAHINGKVEWDLSALSAKAGPGGPKYKGSISTNEINLAGTSTAGACSNLYCHSTVQSGDGTGAPTAYATPVWNDISSNCGSCHLLPNATGSHLRHENGEVAFDCHVCHYNGGTTTPANHASGYIDFEFTSLAANTVYSLGNKVPAGTAYGKCNTSNCHGRFQKVWGAPDSGLTMCDKCHGSATSPGGFYGTKGPGSAVLANESGVGVHDIHIQNPNTPRKATFARFTSYAAAFSCKQCHYVPTGPFTINHIDSALPAESAFSHPSSIAHNGDTFGYYSTPTFNATSKVCSNIWCHGGGMNSNRRVAAKDASLNVLSHYELTTPSARTSPKWNAPFLSGNSASDCTKCHAYPPPSGTTSDSHYGATLVQCTDCHNHVSADGLGFRNKKLHVDGKVDGGCGGCHGNPPITTSLGTIDGLALPAQNALTPGNAGAHNAHQLLPQIGNSCATCHNGYAKQMPSNELEIGFSGLGGLVTTGTFTGYTNSVNGPHWKSSSAGTIIAKSNVKGVVCSNLYCHGGGTGNGSGSDSNNLRPIGGGLNTTPNWEGAVICGDCHGVDNANAPTGGSHPRHALKVAAVGCQSCHGVVEDNGTHINGSLSFKLDRSQFVIGAAATYNGMSSGTLPGLVPHSTYQTCNFIYCHSTVQSSTGNGFAGVSYKTPTWGGAPMVCGACHNNMATAIGAAATGSHEKHANTTSGMNVPCGYCHQDGGDGFDAMHADGNVFVNFTSYLGGVYNVAGATDYNGGKLKVSGSANFSTCSATFCHGTNPSPQWGVPGTNCASCHGASKTQAASWSGRHVTHFDNMTVPTLYTDTVKDKSSVSKYVFNCAHCHDDNVAKHSLMPASANSAARVFFGISAATPAANSRRGIYNYGATALSKTDNGFKSTAGTCNNIYCHSNGKGGLPKVTMLNWTTRPTTGSNCAFCHDTKSTTVASTLAGKHDKHMNPTTNTFIGTNTIRHSFNCADCHAPTITNTNNITIADKRKHVDATVNYSSARAYRSSYTLGSGNCTTYCHSNGNPGAPVFVSMTGSKAWGSVSTYTINNCNKCHGRGNAYGYPDYANGLANSPTSNLHEGHMQGMSSTTACSDCHRKTVDTLVADKFRPYSTTHLSGATNVVFNTAKSYIGSKATVTTSTYTVTCSQIVCHGSGTKIWGTQPSGAAGVRTCTKCHGTRTTADYLTNYSSALIAPGYNNEGTDTAGNPQPTSPRVGAHQRHMNSNAIAAPVKCGECHLAVTNIRGGNHWNYTTATITMNTVRSKGTTPDNPSVSRSSGIMTCNNLWCHTGKYNSGSVAAPFWNATGMVKETANRVDAACTKCHAMPPTAYSGHSGYTVAAADTMATVATVCGSCHSNLDTAATSVANVFKDKSLHVDGIIQGGHPFPYPGSSHRVAAGLTPWAGCNGCHTTAITAQVFPIARGTAPDCTGCHKRPSNETNFGLRTPSGTSSCWDCHGASATDGRPNGSAFPNISGSHTKHVVAQSMLCTDCHYGAGTGSARHGFSNHSAHDNKFVNLSSPSRKFVFTWVGGTGKGTCSTNSCHATAEWGVTKFQCNSCHSYLSTDSWTSTYGVEGIGAHKKHITYISTRFGRTLLPGSDSFVGGNGNAVAVCGVCHDMSTNANHSMGNTVNTRSINLSGATRQFGTSAPLYNGVTGQSSSVNPKSCSNIDCHYRTSPIWSTY